MVQLFYDSSRCRKNLKKLNKKIKPKVEVGLTRCTLVNGLISTD